MNDQNPVPPYNIKTFISRKAMRIKKIISQGIFQNYLSVSFTSPIITQVEASLVITFYHGQKFGRIIIISPMQVIRSDIGLIDVIKQS